MQEFDPFAEPVVQPFDTIGQMWASTLIMPIPETFKRVLLTFQRQLSGEEVRIEGVAETGKRLGSLVGKLTGTLLERKVAYAEQELKQKAERWAALSAMLGAFVTMGLLAFLNVLLGPYADYFGIMPITASGPNGESVSPMQTIIMFTLLSLIWGGLSVQGFRIILAVRSVMAQMLGGGRHLPELTYVTSAYYAPAALISGVLRAVPLVGGFSFPLRAAYTIIVSTIAIKTVYNFDWGRAILANFLTITLGIIVLLAMSPLGGFVFTNWLADLAAQ